MKTFRLPDLGEGLHEAEIVAWHVSVGAEVKADAPLVSVETDKAVTEVPAPWSGRIARLCAAVGERLPVGAPIVEYEDGQRTDPELRSEGSLQIRAARNGAAEFAASAQRHVLPQSAAAAPAHARVRAMPAVRALARELGIDLTGIPGSGPQGAVLVRDVAAAFRQLVAVEAVTAAVAAPVASATVIGSSSGASLSEQVRAGSAAAAEAGWVPMRGPRRSMAEAMARSHATVVPATVHEECDIGDWARGQNIMLRLVRALCRGIRAEPAVNAWYDSARGRLIHDAINIGIAVDTADGLIVPVLVNADKLDAAGFKRELQRLVDAAHQRTLTPADLRGATITLSNFGSIAGTFATPVIVPPQVAILGAGRIRPLAQPRDGGVSVRPMLPLSLTCDHRAVTGGEAARFLKAVVADLEQPA